MNVYSPPGRLMIGGWWWWSVLREKMRGIFNAGKWGFGVCLDFFVFLMGKK